MLQAGIIETSFSGAFLVFLRHDQSGRGERHTVKHTLRLHILASGDALLAFDRLPVLNDLPGVLHLDLAKDVRMAANQFGAYLLEDIANAEVTVLACDFCMQVDLE